MSGQEFWQLLLNTVSYLEQTQVQIGNTSRGNNQKGTEKRAAPRGPHVWLPMYILAIKYIKYQNGSKMVWGSNWISLSFLIDLALPLPFILFPVG